MPHKKSGVQDYSSNLRLVEVMYLANILLSKFLRIYCHKTRIVYLPITREVKWFYKTGFKNTSENHTWEGYYIRKTKI